MDLEERRLNLQISLDKQKSAKERNTFGQFSTPYDLASSIVAFIKSNIKLPEHVHFLEPAIGTGVFFSALRSQISLDKAVGYEIDPHYSIPSNSLWEKENLDIITGDFLSASPQKKFNLIIANPPYSRHHHIDIDRKKFLAEAIKREFGIKISGLAGLYCYFLILSTLWLERDGISVWLIPTEFMDVNYGNALRKFLTTKVELLYVHKFEATDLQFPDALVSSCVVAFKNQKSTQRQAIFSSGSDILHPNETYGVAIDQLIGSDKWSAFFRKTCFQISENNVPLGTYFNVSRGISTGNNSFFILNKDSSEVKDFPKEFLRHILPSPRYLHTDEIKYGEIETYCQYLFSCSLPIETIERHYPIVAEYIHNAEKENMNKGYNCSKRNPWYSTEQRDPAPFFLTYMGRGDNHARMFRFILNNTNAIVTNSYLILYPKKEYLLDFNILEIRRKVWDVLCNIPKEEIMHCGRCYGGGLYKIEPKELLKVKIPPLDSILKYSQKSLFD